MYHTFIGIDIGKSSFYSVVYGNKKARVYNNNLQGFQQFCKDHAKVLNGSFVVLETTGGYEIALINHLKNYLCVVHRANTRKVKHFLRSLGKIGKSDAIDAAGLAQYGFERHAILEPYCEPAQKRLLKLVQRQADLKQLLVQEKNRSQAPDHGGLQDSFEAIIKALEAEISKLGIEIDQIIKNDPKLCALKKVCKTVPGVGDVTANALMAMVPEMGTVNRKQIASLVGVAPHPNESGDKIGHRYMRGGRSEVKSILFMAALSSTRSKSELGEFYKRHIDNGKNKMVALGAVMRKMIVIVNARVRDELIRLEEEKLSSNVAC